MNYDDMSYDELRELKQGLWLEAKVIREEMLEISSFMSVKQAERHAEMRRIAENTPGAIMAEIEGVAAEAASRAGKD